MLLREKLSPGKLVLGKLSRGKLVLEKVSPGKLVLEKVLDREKEEYRRNSETLGRIALPP